MSAAASGVAGGSTTHKKAMPNCATYQHAASHSIAECPVPSTCKPSLLTTQRDGSACRPQPATQPFNLCKSAVCRHIPEQQSKQPSQTTHPTQRHGLSVPWETAQKDTDHQAQKPWRARALVKCNGQTLAAAGRGLQPDLPQGSAHPCMQEQEAMLPRQLGRL